MKYQHPMMKLGMLNPDQNIGSFATQDLGPTVVWTPPWLEKEEPEPVNVLAPEEEFVPVMTHAELINSAQAGAMTHIRPLAQKEMNALANAMNTGIDVNGVPLTKYQEVAIAQFIYENMLNFAPDANMDAPIKDRLKDIEKVDMIFTALYQDYLRNLRKSVQDTKAEDVALEYTVLERLRLKNQGIAFNEMEAETPEEVALEDQIQAQSKPVDNFAHPMLKFGLIKKK